MDELQLNQILKEIVHKPENEENDKISIDNGQLKVYLKNQQSSVQFFVHLLEAVPNFLLEEHGSIEESASVKEIHTIQTALFESFFLWIDPSISFHSDKNTKSNDQGINRKSEYIAEVGVAEDAAEARSALSVEEDRNKLIANMPADDRILLVDRILNLKISTKASTWKSIINSLQLNSEALEPFLETVGRARRNGTATFELLSVCIADQQLRGHFAPDVLLEALLLGDLATADIEKFADSNDSPAFRDQCRQVLRRALEIAGKGYVAEEWAKLMKDQFNKEHTSEQEFWRFSSHVRELLPKLGDDLPISMDRGWGIPRKYGLEMIQKTIQEYANKRLNRVQFRERIWTVLAQRSGLKSDAIKEIRKAKNVPEQDLEASYWEGIEKFSRQKISDVDESDETDAVNGDKFHVLPPHLKDKIEFINEGKRLATLIDDLKHKKDKCGPGKPVVVGVDIEWSAYRQYAGGSNRASILQIAVKGAVKGAAEDAAKDAAEDAVEDPVNDAVYVVDLIGSETKEYKQSLIQFLSKLFSDEQIIKIGTNFCCFQKIKLNDHSLFLGDKFQGDLRILRLAFPSCKALYSPVRLVCISEIIDQTKKGEGKKPLADLCKDYLDGKPLNKIEQKSVWDRRPLRKSQLSYAALDAYCLVELFNYCASELENLGKNAYDIANAVRVKYAQPDKIRYPLFVRDVKVVDSQEENLP